MQHIWINGQYRMRKWPKNGPSFVAQTRPRKWPNSSRASMRADGRGDAQVRANGRHAGAGPGVDKCARGRRHDSWPPASTGPNRRCRQWQALRRRGCAAGGRGELVPAGLCATVGRAFGVEEGDTRRHAFCQRRLITNLNLPCERITENRLIHFHRAVGWVSPHFVRVDTRGPDTRGPVGLRQPPWLHSKRLGNQFVRSPLETPSR